MDENEKSTQTARNNQTPPDPKPEEQKEPVATSDTSPSAEELAEFRKWKDSQKSEAEKTANAIAKAEKTRSEAEKQLAQLKAELDKTKLDYAVKTALQGANAIDSDYLMFKLREGGEPLELDENGNIKGIDEKLTTLRTVYPAMFGQGGKDGYQILGDNKLPQSNHDSGMSKADLLKKPYAERAKFYAENPDAYKEIMK